MMIKRAILGTVASVIAIGAAGWFSATAHGQAQSTPEGGKTATAIFAGGCSNFLAVRGDHATVRDVHRRHTFPHANNQRSACEKAQRFAGETRRAQASWDDGEGLHTPRRTEPTSPTDTEHQCRARRAARQRCVHQIAHRIPGQLPPTSTGDAVS